MNTEINVPEQFVYKTGSSEVNISVENVRYGSHPTSIEPGSKQNPVAKFQKLIHSGIKEQ
jgi:hypothetical protein